MKIELQARVLFSEAVDYQDEGLGTEGIQYASQVEDA